MNWLLISDVTKALCILAWGWLGVAVCLPGACRYMFNRSPRRYDALRLNSVAIGVSFLLFSLASYLFRSTVLSMPVAELQVRSALYVYASLAALNRYTTVRAYERSC